LIALSTSCTPSSVYDLSLSPSFCSLLSSLTTTRPPPTSPLFPYTTLFRSAIVRSFCGAWSARSRTPQDSFIGTQVTTLGWGRTRSEEHTSELQSRFDLVCRLLLETKNLLINLITSHLYYSAIVSFYMFIFM